MSERRKRLTQAADAARNQESGRVPGYSVTSPIPGLIEPVAPAPESVKGQKSMKDAQDTKIAKNILVRQSKAEKEQAFINKVNENRLSPLEVRKKKARDVAAKASEKAGKKVRAKPTKSFGEPFDSGVKGLKKIPADKVAKPPKVFTAREDITPEKREPELGNPYGEKKKKPPQPKIVPPSQRKEDPLYRSKGAKSAPASSTLGRGNKPLAAGGRRRRRR